MVFQRQNEDPISTRVGRRGSTCRIAIRWPFSPSLTSQYEGYAFGSHFVSRFLDFRFVAACRPESIFRGPVPIGFAMERSTERQIYEYDCQFRLSIARDFSFRSY